MGTHPQKGMKVNGIRSYTEWHSLSKHLLTHIYMRQIILSLFLTSGILSVYADEGMWMLTDLKQQNEVAMTELGLLIPAEQIYNPNSIALKDAVVHFGGGCTGEVISAEGWY